MEPKKVAVIAFGIIVSFLYSVVSWFVRDTKLIWFQSRIMGLFAFITLFAAVFLGELRLLSTNKGRFRIFRYHKPLAVLSIFLVASHFLASLFDNYKWGKNLSLKNYLGFSFSDRWLIFLSLGIWAFYFMLLVGLSSSRKSMQFLKFRRWKLIHYFSYLSFAFAYIHSVNLGTDIKSSLFSPFLKPLFSFMFIMATALLLTRIVRSFGLLSAQTEIALAAIFFVLLISGLFLGLSSFYSARNQVEALQASADSYAASVSGIESDIAGISKFNRNISLLISKLNSSIDSLSLQIEAVHNG